MLRIFILFGAAVLASGAYTYRPSGQRAPRPARPVTNRVAPALPPQPPSSFLSSSISHNITFSITGKDLPSKFTDTIDPYIKAYITSKTIIEPEKFGTTEVMDNNPNPEFATILSFPWKQGTNQNITFKLKDSDRLRDNHISEATMQADTFAANGFKANLSLSTGGTLLIQKTTPIKLMLFARKIPRLDHGITGTGKSDPFVSVFWRRGSRGQARKFYTTAVLDNVENPDWEEVIEFPNYIKGTDLWLTFEVRDSDGANRDDFIGDVDLELDPWVEKRRTKIMRLGTDGQSQLGITPA